MSTVVEGGRGPGARCRVPVSRCQVPGAGFQLTVAGGQVPGKEADFRKVVDDILI